MSNKQIYSRLISIKRQVMVRTMSRLLPLYILNEYPKSGGSWFGEMLSEALGIAFPRNRPPRLEACIMHGHYLHAAGMKNLIVLLRDGRDLMVSYYFHCYFRNAKHNRAFVEIMRRELPFENYGDIKENLPAFMERMLRNPIYPRFTWQRFIENWYGRRGVVVVRYEDLLKDATVELSRTIVELGCEAPAESRLREIVGKYSFVRQTGRLPGFENRNQFIRKGIAGDWKNKFSREACEIFDHYAGDALIALGYEPDREWTSVER